MLVLQDATTPVSLSDSLATLVAGEGESVTIVEVHCPNCGNLAERHHLHEDQLTRTQCDTCDYLMITCSRTYRVIEAYAPGLLGPG